MQDSKQEYISLKCGRCDKKSSMRVVATYLDRDVVEDEHGNAWLVSTEIMRLSFCPACDVVNFSSEIEGTGNPDVLWPSNKALLGLPPTIDKAYKAARNVQRIDNNAFAVLL